MDNYNKQLRIDNLIERFETACEIYKLALVSRVSNRSQKELLRGNAKGTVLYKVQCNFAWALHDLTMGPPYFFDTYYAKVEDVISYTLNYAKI